MDGETRKQKKPLYKSGWGWLLLIFIWPFYLLWKVWSKSDWNLAPKIVLSIILLPFAIFYTSSFAIGMSSISSNSSSKTPSTQLNPPKVEYKDETVTETISYSTNKKDDPNLLKGQEKETQKGENGIKSVTYIYKYIDGVKIESSKEKKSEIITKLVVDQIIAVGTYVAPPVVPTPKQKPQSNCDPNYSGCVPIASDVDCAGGSGNGPAYVAGPVEVIGSDIYGLDRDGDGIACE